MREIPVLFSTPMVQAILALIKRMTRRTKGLEKINENPDEWMFDGLHAGQFFQFMNKETGYHEMLTCPYGKPGDILWVRETWKCVQYDSMDGNLGYEVEFRDGERKYFEFDDNERFHQFGKFAFKEGWQSSLFMPREAARIFLKVTNVKVERLQEITVDDCRLEGCCCSDCLQTGPHSPDCKCDTLFHNVWNDISAKRGYGWQTNPWVWIIEFERVEVHK